MPKLDTAPPRPLIEAMRGLVDFACWKGIYYARAWPRPRKSTVTIGNEQQIADFAAIQRAMTLVQESERAPSIEIARGTKWAWRDVLTNAAWGKLIDFQVPPPKT